MNYDVVVIGSGIVGSACSYYLAKAGQKVLVVDQAGIGAGASKAGQTDVVSWEGPDINLALSKLSGQLYLELAAELPLDFELRHAGGLMVIETPEQKEIFMKEVQHLRAWGVPAEVFDGQEMAVLEPNLAPGLAGGVLFPADLQVNPLLATHALALGAKQHGAVLMPFTTVTSIDLAPGGDAVLGVTTNRERISSGSVVIAAGAWSGEVGKLAGLEIPISPRKGTIVLTEPVPDDYLRHKMMLSASYLSSITNPEAVRLAGSPVINQTLHGNLMLGSSRQFVGFDRRVEAWVAAIILQRCLRILPGLAKLRVVRTWAGLRPYSADLLPIISGVDEIAGLYIAAGHEGMGITEGPATGKIISQMVTGQPTEIPVGELAFSRFKKKETA